MPRYVFTVGLNRRPSDPEIDVLRAAAGSAARVERDERCTVLHYSRDTATLSHAIADTVAEITQLPGLHPWWTEPHR